MQDLCTLKLAYLRGFTTPDYYASSCIHNQSQWVIWLIAYFTVNLKIDVIFFFFKFNWTIWQV